MGKVAVLELDDLELGKHATSQLRDYFEDIEKRKVRKATEIPFVLDQMLEDAQGAVLLVDTTEQKYMEQVIDKVLEIEMEKGKPVQQLLLEKEDESREAFQERSRSETREQAEILADKVNSINREDYDRI